MENGANNGAGSRLRQIRKDLGMRQIDFVKTAGVSQSFLCRVELGEYLPSTEIMLQVDRLGYSANWLLTGKGEPRLPTPMVERAADTVVGYGEPEVTRKEIAELRAEAANLVARLDGLLKKMKGRKP
jgi:transcriptional regulator with XRE-family HTH domain